MTTPHITSAMANAYCYQVGLCYVCTRAIKSELTGRYECQRYIDEQPQVDMEYETVPIHPDLLDDTL